MGGGRATAHEPAQHGTLALPEPKLVERLNASESGEGFGFSLALSGDFARDADRVRGEASKLRAQADALEVIAHGIDQLADTV